MMILDNSTRKKLRQQMELAFDTTSLDLFLQDVLDRKLEDIIPPGNVFPMQCQLVIKWAEREGCLLRFLQAIMQDHPNVAFQTFASDLIAMQQATAPVLAGSAARPYMVSQRPMLDRSTLWQRLAALAGGTAPYRVLIVNGGVGKTYSRWPVSHICGPSLNFARLACVEANAGKVVNVDGARLAGLIGTRLWGNSSLSGEEDLAQPQRITNDLGSIIVQRLGALQERTCIVVDELNLVNLDDTATELLRRLCHAIDGNECPQVWLLLIGLDPAKLGPRVGPYVCVDEVQRPSYDDIKDYLTWFAGTVGKPLDPAGLSQTVQALDTILSAAPDHSNWDDFHRLLSKECRQIAGGTP